MPSSVRFAEVRRLLEEHGYGLKRISGSHHIFDKPGERPVPIPVHDGKVKYVYLRQILKRLEGN
jgi:predicted RNA binding protein YcfA (HicA-like mRNA interferase family)